MKKIMILGAGSGQIPFICAARQKGYNTIVVSPKGNYPGFAFANKCYYFDTRDKEKILEVARFENISAIATDQTDVAVPTVAYVAENMGLRGIGQDLALKFTNKYEMRNAAKHVGIAVPRYAKASNLSEAIEIALEISFPIIIKPLDSSGSRGVIKIITQKELEQKFVETASFSTDNSIIVEQFIEGREYLADGFAMEGIYHTLDVGIKEYFDLPEHFISKMCMFFSSRNLSDPIMRRVAQTNDDLIRGMGLPFGITHAEYLHSYKDDKIYLVECAARGGGVYLSSHLTPNATGFNTNDALLDYLVDGVSRVVDPIKLANKVSAWLCFSLPSGEIASITGNDRILQIPNVTDIFINKLIKGYKTNFLRDDTDKYGPILFCANNEPEIRQSIEIVKKNLDITVKTSDGFQGIIW